jgi:LAT3 family solute carrier family 43 protein 3
MSFHAHLPVRFRRWILYAFAFSSVSLAGGLVYGWPALRQQLKRDGSVLSEKQLGAAFTAGAWSTQGCRFLTGIARDRFGTKIVTILAFGATAMGALGMALVDPNQGPAISIALAVMGLGSGVQLCLQPVASLFPSNAGAVLASLSGAFQVSGLVFLGLTSAGASRKATFGGFCAVMLGMALLAALLLPTGTSYLLESKSANPATSANSETDPTFVSTSEPQLPTVVEDTESDPASPQGKNTGVVNRIQSNPSTKCNTTADVEDTSSALNQLDNKPIEEDVSVWELMWSTEYILLVCWFSVLVVPLQYYIGGLGFQLEDKGDDDGFYTDLFSILYASAAVVSPAAGFLADKLGLGWAELLSSLLCSVSFFVLAGDANLDVQVIGLAANGLGRMLVFSMFFSHVGKRFGYKSFGTLAGLGLLISAIASLLQYPIIAAASDGHARLVNLICGVVLVTFTPPYCVWLHRTIQREESLPKDIEDVDDCQGDSANGLAVTSSRHLNKRATSIGDDSDGSASSQSQ